MELRPITISFKKTPEEIELYKIISEHSSKGAFIKDQLIEKLIKNKGSNESRIEMNSVISTPRVDELSEILDV